MPTSNDSLVILSVTPGTDVATADDGTTSVINVQRLELKIVINDVEYSQPIQIAENADPTTEAVKYAKDLRDSLSNHVDNPPVAQVSF